MLLIKYLLSYIWTQNVWELDIILDGVDLIFISVEMYALPKIPLAHWIRNVSLLYTMLHKWSDSRYFPIKLYHQSVTTIYVKDIPLEQEYIVQILRVLTTYNLHSQLLTLYENVIWNLFVLFICCFGTLPKIVSGNFIIWVVSYGQKYQVCIVVVIILNYFA